MLMNIFRKRVVNNNWLFNGNYIDAKGLFLYQFDEICSISYITQIDVTKAYSHLRDLLQHDVTAVHQHSEFNYEENRMLFNVSFMVLTNKRIVETGADYIALLHTANDYGWANELLKNLSQFRTEVATTAKIGFVRQQSMN